MYLTVLRSHSREGHLQYLRSLEADLSNAAQVEDYGAEESESVAGSYIDKEGEAVACELGIKYPTLQAIYAGKLNKESIQVISTYDIIYNIICSYMISLLISHMFQVQGKKTYAGQTTSAAYHHFTGKE